jgi:hypothetical protein
MTHEHKKFMAAHIDNYDWFIYVEDDIDLRLSHWLNFMKAYNLLRKARAPENMMPRFVRIELCDLPPETHPLSPPSSERVRYIISYMLHANIKLMCCS